MTAEVSYGQFMDVIEEFAFPEEEQQFDNNEGSSKQYYPSGRKHQTSAQNQAGLLALFFHAMERANFSQLESSGSLASLSSQSSLSSYASRQPSEAELSQMGKLYQAMQQVLLPVSESTTQLKTMEEFRSQVNSISNYLPSVFVNFVRSFDEFMHNPAFEDRSE